MKNYTLLLFFLIAVAHTTSAQITDSLYKRLPWRECFPYYTKFSDYYFQSEIDSFPDYRAVGALKCGDHSRIFLMRSDSLRQEILMPAELKEPFVIVGLYYNRIDKQLLVEVKKHKDDTKEQFLYFSFTREEKGYWLNKKEVKQMYKEREEQEFHDCTHKLD